MVLNEALHGSFYNSLHETIEIKIIEFKLNLIFILQKYSAFSETYHIVNDLFLANEACKTILNCQQKIPVQVIVNCRTG